MSLASASVSGRAHSGEGTREPALGRELEGKGKLSLTLADSLSLTRWMESIYYVGTLVSGMLREFYGAVWIRCDYIPEMNLSWF